MERQKTTNIKSGRILLEKLHNTRDLGGFVGADGRIVKSGRLIRSGTLCGASEEDLRILTEVYHLGTIVDFRTAAECRQQPDPDLEGVTTVFNPILDEKTVGITFEEEEGAGPLEGFLKHAESLEGDPRPYIAQLYRNLVTDDHAVSQYGRFFDILLEADERAVLWHCSAGKDRVGIGTALLLMALGVERETVVADFIKTNEYVKGETDRLVAAVSKISRDSAVLNSIAVLNGVNECYIREAFTTIEEEFGTVEQYLARRLGITQEKKNALQNKYLALAAAL